MDLKTGKRGARRVLAAEDAERFLARTLLVVLGVLALVAPSATAEDRIERRVPVGDLRRCETALVGSDRTVEGHVRRLVPGAWVALDGGTLVARGTEDVVAAVESAVKSMRKTARAEAREWFAKKITPDDVSGTFVMFTYTGVNKDSETPSVGLHARGTPFDLQAFEDFGELGADWRLDDISILDLALMADELAIVVGAIAATKNPGGGDLSIAILDTNRKKKPDFIELRLDVEGADKVFEAIDAALSPKHPQAAKAIARLVSTHR